MDCRKSRLKVRKNTLIAVSPSTSISAARTCIAAWRAVNAAPDAAERLRQDFHLDTPTSSRPDPTTKVKARQRRDENERFNKRWGFLCDVVHEADAELPRYDRETAWDNPRDTAIKEQLRKFALRSVVERRRRRVYVLTNFWSTHQEDVYRIAWLYDNGFDPYVMIYNKDNAPSI